MSGETNPELGYEDIGGGENEAIFQKLEMPEKSQVESGKETNERELTEDLIRRAIELGGNGVLYTKESAARDGFSYDEIRNEIVRMLYEAEDGGLKPKVPEITAKQERDEKDNVRGIRVTYAQSPEGK